MNTSPNNVFYYNPPRPIDFDGKPMNDNQIAAANLRFLMNEAEGENRCILCKAAQKLEDKDNQQNFTLPLVALAMLAFNDIVGNGSDMNTINTMIKTCFETLENINKEKENHTGNKTNCENAD